MLDRLIGFFSSLRLTVVCLAFGVLLVFAGTIAQVEMGLYKAQNEFFRSFFVVWHPAFLPFKVPMPGGYLIGGVLTVNLVSSLLTRFRFSTDKMGIWLIHIGLILLLLGQLATDLLSVESNLHLREGETRNYSESGRQAELVFKDVNDSDTDRVVSIPQSLLARRGEIQLPEFPFTLKVVQFHENSVLQNRPPNSSEPAAATQGVGPQAILKPVPRVTVTEKRDVPSVVFELLAAGKSLGTWVASEYISDPQVITHEGKRYEVSMRLHRYYKPFSLHLKEFRHDLYPGTDIPKNFSSRLQLVDSLTGEDREVLIKMNSPLRYRGETLYQASFDQDNQGTILQVVRNPGWLTPYFSCVLVGLGLLVQFSVSLFGFTFKKRTS